MNAKKTKEKLSVEDRLDRLERLVVRALLGMPAGRTGSQLINVESMPRATSNALNKRFWPWAGGEDKAEAEYALNSILDICADSITAKQDKKANADAKAAELIRDGKRAAAEEVKRVAEKTARAAQEEIDALSNPETANTVIG